MVAVAHAQWSTTSNNIYNTNTGYVGIGKSTPTVELDVLGKVAAEGFQLLNNGWSDNAIQSVYGSSIYELIGTYNAWDPNGVFIAAYNQPNGQSTGVNYQTKNVYIGNPFTGSNYVAVNLVTGGVGIGTTHTNDPNNRLFVETGIRTRQVTVDQATWPDYVFAPSYKLPSLDSVSRYIECHHRLSDMPSADSVAKNGVELGAGEAKLLKKIEELTLYVIELNKKNENLQNEVDELKELVDKKKGR